MIRLFTILYKTDFNHVPSGIELYNAIHAKVSISSLQCPPPCKTRGYMVGHGSYERYLVDYDHGVQNHTVCVERGKCRPCGRTHAALADVLVPHRSYSIIFILTVLKEYFHTHAATGICEKYGMAVSTLYAWRNHYLSHASLDLGASVEEALLHKSRWLECLPDVCRSGMPRDFFMRFGFSFLQHNQATVFSSA